MRRGLAILLLIAGCGAPPRVYSFVHMETTGLTTAVLVDGERVTIAWDPASDARALASLDALRSETFLDVATRGSALRVVGVLAPEVRQTTAVAQGAASEPYRSFVLHDWYVVVPFVRFVPASEDPLAGMVAGPLAEHLEAGDFEPSPGGARPDPRRHERAR